MTDSPVHPTPKPWNERYDTHVPNGWVSENRYPGRSMEKRDLPDFSQARKLLPEPFWAGHAGTMDCYWRAWELAFGNLKQPTPENDFVSNYCDTAFNGNLFMWDSSFVTGFGLYGRRAFNFQATLDNFYRKQHADGFICREISELDGQDTYQRFDPASTGPDVLGWAEWNHYTKTGDGQRLQAVFPVLLAFHQWLRTYRTWPDGSYWTSGWGSGMDNLPRLKSSEHINFSHGHMSWVDATLQACLSARVLLQMTAVLGRQDQAGDLEEELERLEKYANQALWNDKLSFYCDRNADGSHSPVKHIGGFWALLARAVPEARLSDLVAHLENPHEFNRLHRVPALSADDPGYSGSGGYWCGGIWAPTNYMVLKGLEANGQFELAHQIASNHLENVVRVFLSDARWDGAQQFKDFFHIDELPFDDKHTLWETYAADVSEPGSHSKPGYVGWSGLPPIAVLLEDVFGLAPDAVAQRLTWRVRLLEEHGVKRYPFGLNGVLDLKCSSRTARSEHPSIEIHSNIPLTVEVIWEGGTDSLKIEKEA
jgi:hypothetical protein